MDTEETLEDLPAYELTEQQFDQKTSHILQTSLSDPLQEEEVWEVWDEAQFEANARNPSAGGSSSSTYPVAPLARPEKAPLIEEPAVQPLRIAKKAAQTTHLYSKANDVGDHRPMPPPPPARSNSPSLHPTDNQYAPSRSMSIMSIGRRTPPPAFEHEGPSLDGPEYEETVLSYQPSPGDSAPDSSPYYSQQPPPLGRPQPSSPSPYQRQTFTNRVPQRPQVQYPPGPRRNVALPHNFNAMAAYNKPNHHTSPHNAPKVDASAFYNSAVSSHMVPKVPPRPPQQPFRPTQMYQQDMPSTPQFSNYHSPYSGGNYTPHRPPSVTSTDSNHSQPYYTQPSLAANRPDTRWQPAQVGYQSFNPNR